MRLALARRARPERGVLAGVGEALSFAVSSRRVAVTFFTVLLVSTFSFNFDVLLPLVAKLTLDQGAGTFGLIASVFGGGASCGALILATIGQTRLLLVLVGAVGFGTSQLVLAPQAALPRLLLLFVAGHLLHPLGLERPRDAAALRTGAPARASGEPLLLRLHGRRAARRADRGLADRTAAERASPSPSAARWPYSSPPPARPCSMPGRPAREHHKQPGRSRHDRADIPDHALHASASRGAT